MSAALPQPAGFSPNGQWAFSASLLKVWLQCPRKYLYSVVHGWTPLRPNDHLKFGSLVAEALAKYHNLRAGGASKDDALIDTLRDALVASHGWESMTRGKNRESLVRTIVWYLDHYPEEMLSVATVGGETAAELHFQVPLFSEDGDDIVWFGYFDQILDLPNGTYVVDQKTTSGALSQQWLDQWHLDLQMTGYAFVAKIGYGLALSGVIVDGMQTGQGFTRFARTVTLRSDEAIEEWLGETKDAIAAARRAYRTGNFPKNTTACGTYGGCPYRRVCAASPRLREHALAADFEPKPHVEPFTHPQ